MTRFAASVAFLYPHLAYLERFAAARADGFDAVETTWPLVDAADVVDAVRRADLRVVLLNVREGDLAGGDRGHPNDPGRIDEWRADLDRALDLAAALGCPTLNVLAGNRVDGVAVRQQAACLTGNLAWAMQRASAAGVELVVELLNAPEHPRYLARDLRATLELLGPDRADGLGLQFDTYHVAMNGLDIVETFREVGGLVGHVQVADVPGRHEPGTGSLDWDAFFTAVDETGYGGFVGLEYRPRADTSEGLAWLARERRGSAADGGR